MKDIMNSLKRNEPVTLLRRGKVVGMIQPPEAASASVSGLNASAHPAFGMWKDRPDFEDVEAAIERLRGGRFNAL